MDISTHRSRRRLLTLAGGVTLAVLLSACGDTAPGSSQTTSSGTPSTSAASGPWEFTDDRGKKISLPQRPTRIVMQVNAAAALDDFGIKPTAVFGPRELESGQPDPQAGDVSPDVPSVGTEFGEFNMEKYLEQKPELLVTIMYGEALWYVPEESAAQIEEKAPIVAIQLAGVPADEAIAKFGKLAESLGADLNTPELAKAKQDFEAASASLKKAAEGKAGLKTLVVQGIAEEAYLAKPSFFSDVSYFGKLGLDLVAPTEGEAPTWETISWEQVSKYPADLILTDARDQALSQSDLAKIPTWAQLPAVRAGQLGLWHAETPMSYQKLTPALIELTEVVSKARTDVVA
ncbi:MAG: ABC transporter substrate-binding protein [Actinomycetota bacterium]|nr:ABC transporter substrate-binding protein [Actinomycetota bacterium]